MADPRKTLAPIKKLLLARDDDTIRQGVELLRALDDPSLFDALLTGVRWRISDATTHVPDPVGALEVTGFCANAAVTGRWDLVVALSLLAAAPPESAVAAGLVASCTSLTMDRGGDYRNRFSADLGLLATLVNLEHLVVRGGLGPTNLAALTKLPRLRRLELVVPIDDISGLSGCAALETLRVSSASFATPGALRDVPALRELSLADCYQLQSIEFLRALDGVERLSLTLHAFHGDVSPLGGLRSLRSLQIHGGSTSFTSVEALAGCAKLEDVTLERCGGLTTLAPLKGLRHLRRLSVDGCSKLERLDLDGVTTLESFSARWTALKDLDCLAGCALTTAGIEGMANLERLDGLRSTTAIRRLNLNTPNLASLSGLEGCADLESLSMRSCKGLTSLAGLSHARRLQSLSLRECESLASIDGVERCEALTDFVVEGGAYSDLSPLASLTSLERVSLRGCARVTDLSPLAALPKLRALVLSGTGVDRASVPARLKHVTSFAQDADLAKLAAKPAPEARGPVIPAAVGAEHRKAWTQIKKLLLTRDHETVDQGVELVRALDDAAIFDELLRGVTWTPPDRRHPLGQVALEGTWFDDTEPARAFRIRAVLALAAAAPADCEPANAFKSALKMLSFHGGKDPKRPCPFDAAPLTAFRHLATLELIDAPALTHAEALSSLPALSTLWARGVTGWAGVDFSAMTALRALTLHDVTLGAVVTLRDAPSLTTVTLSHVRGAGALSLDAHPTLTNLSVWDAGELRAVSLRDCPALTEARLYRLPALESVDLRGCAALSVLNVSSNPSLAEVRGLDALTALHTLSATYGPTAWLPRAPLTALTGLHTLDLSGAAQLDLSRVANFPSVRVLTLDGSSEVSDLSPLSALKSLGSLSLRWCAKVTDLTPLEGLSLFALRAQGTKVPPERVPLALRRFVK